MSFIGATSRPEIILMRLNKAVSGPEIILMSLIKTVSGTKIHLLSSQIAIFSAKRR